MAFPFIVILNLISTLLDQFAKNKIYKKKSKTTVCSIIP